MRPKASNVQAILQKDKPQNRTIVVTHYIPYKCTLTNQGWHFGNRRDHGALYAGIQSLAQSVIVGSLDYYYDADDQRLPIGSLEDKQLLERELRKMNCHVVWIDADLADQHYKGFCKTNLWPLLHYLLWQPTDGKMEAVWWNAYKEVNQRFALVVQAVYQDQDVIWINDYHYMLLPEMLRSTLSKAVIGLFLHAPFPSSELFRCLPQRRDILQGVLGCNMIGFQTYSYARHFISSCTRILGCESNPKGVEFHGHQVAIGIFPIGIDVQECQLQMKQKSVQDKIAAIRDLYPGKKIIIGRDKLDQIKGVQHKLNAFEKFLQEYPEWAGQVVLIQVTSPTSENYKLETKMSEVVSRINGVYGSLGFVPVHHYHQTIGRDEYLALLSIADVALITSVRDGMNTTSHEFVVCQQNHYGPLILSEFTGTAGSLSSAISVNPWDYGGVAAAIQDALTMSKEEKFVKHSQLFQYVTNNTAKFWASSFVNELQLTTLLPDKSNPTPLLDLDKCLDAFKKAKKRIFFLDYDGTLTPIRTTPGAAVPSDTMLKALSILSKCESVLVYVVSGRDQAALDNWLGDVPQLGMSAEHGCFVKYVNTQKWINLSEDLDLSWKNDVLPIFEYYTERTPGSHIEQKRSSLTWHYRQADPQYGSWQARECHNHLENAIVPKHPIEVMVGKKNLEVRFQAINKGEIVRRLLQLHSDADFVFCSGDDVTDEMMFDSIRKVTLPEGSSHFSVTIGTPQKMTKADWHVEQSDDLVSVLTTLASQVLK